MKHKPVILFENHLYTVLIPTQFAPGPFSFPEPPETYEAAVKRTGGLFIYPSVVFHSKCKLH